MKTLLKRTGIWLILSILMSVFWIIGLMTGNAIFPNSLMQASGESSGGTELFLFLTCAINTGAVLYYLYNSQIFGWKLVGNIFLIVFGIQFFMSQIETIWFNGSLQMETGLILAIVSGGAIMALLFAVTATWISGRFVKTEKPPYRFQISALTPFIKEIILLAAVLWPAVYFLAGYYIAWQFEAVRIYYSGSPMMESIFVMMKENIVSGLYFFQILRGFLWVIIALLIITTVDGSWLRRGLILGLLLSALGSSQLLLPNPIMPEQVRIAHLLETSISSFIWGFILAWFLRKIHWNPLEVSLINDGI